MKFKKKPVVIEAVKWDGKEFSETLKWVEDAFDKNMDNDGAMDRIVDILQIRTKEGVMMVNPGDMIIKGVSNELYPCKPDIFEKTYTPVPEVEREKHRDRLHIFLSETLERWDILFDVELNDDSADDATAYLITIKDAPSKTEMSFILQASDDNIIEMLVGDDYSTVDGEDLFARLFMNQFFTQEEQ